MNKNNPIDIAKKWYDVLGFSEKYDVEFQRLVETHENLEKVDVMEYEFSEDAGKNLLMCLYFCEALEQRYIQKSIPHKILEDTLSDILLWTNIYYELNKTLGLAETDWLKNHLSFRLFRLGRLQFNMESSPCDILEIGVKKEDAVLGVHIPRGEALDHLACIQSIELAKDFFETYFPEVSYQCFLCDSWLLDDTLQAFLNEDSNIVKFQRMFVPVEKRECYDILKYTLNWNATKSNVKNYVPRNTFTRKVKEYVEQDGKFYIVLGYIK